MDSPQPPHDAETPSVGAVGVRPVRLVGLHDDGDHLVLSSETGEEFLLPITDALRQAVSRRPLNRPAAAVADAASEDGDEGHKTLSPREIQELIRAGHSVEELHEEYDVSLTRLRVYETPVIAERRWIADQARTIEVSSPQPGHDMYRAVFGDEPALLEPMVRHRLTSMGMDPASMVWDAWRDVGATHWTISLEFSPEGAGSPQIGDEPVAMWTYRPSAKHLDNMNRWAQVLSELEPVDTPTTSTGGRRLSAVTDADLPFNVGVPGRPSQSEHSGRHIDDQQLESQEELLEVLKARRGQRLGVDEDADDELALMITRDEHPTNFTGPQLVVAPDEDAADEEDTSSPAVDEADPDVADDAATAQTAEDSEQQSQAVDEPAPADEAEAEAPESPKPAVEAVDGPDAPVSFAKRRERKQRAAEKNDSDEDNQQIEGQMDAFDGLSEDETRQALRKDVSKSPKRRSSIPTWDEIMFGTRKDD